MSEVHVAALLPLRIETRFIPPGVSAVDATQPDEATTWRLRVRVAPDTISIDAHSEAVDAAELAGLRALWVASAVPPDPEDMAAAVEAARGHVSWADAFGRLAAQTGAARAAWLVRNVRATRSSEGIALEPPAVGEGRAGGVVRALPADLAVWARWSGEPDAEVIGTLRPDPAVYGVPLLEGGEWLTSWEGGVAAGVAAEIALSRDPVGIDVLGVSGLGSGDGTDLPGLLGAHAAAGAISLLAPGQATSIVHGAPVAAARGTGGAATLKALLGGDGAGMGPVPGDDELDDPLEGDLVRALFPALWGYGLAGVLGVVPPEELPPLWRWAGEWLRPQGPFATLQVRGTEYGVQPVLPPGAPTIGESLAGAARVVPLVERAIGHWASAANADSGVVGGGVADVVRTVRRGPVPGRFGRSDLVPVDLLAAVNGEAVEDARHAWDAEHPPVGDVVPFTDELRRYRALTPRVGAVRLPLIAAEGGEDQVLSAIEELRWGDPGWLSELQLSNGSVLIPHPARWDPLDSEQYAELRTLPSSLLARLLLRSYAVAATLLDLTRQRLSVAGGLPFLEDLIGRPEPPHVLVERLVPRGRRTLARRHVNALHMLRGSAEGLDLVDRASRSDSVLEGEYLWLSEGGFRLVLDVVKRSGGEPEFSRRAHRALRAVLDTAGGRWEPWWSAVAAAHLADVQREHPGAPAPGAYGWVDAPARGTAGPGPGGLLLAPTLEHARTAAALRDRAVHDGDRWAWHVTSEHAGPAQALLADLALGWHPAELLGRLIEERLAAEAAAEVTAHDLEPLRQAFPLREGQGPFGCVNGLRLLDTLGAALDVPGAVWTRQELETAIEHVRTVWRCAADLALAEGVHDLLAGRPARAASATELLAGQVPPGPMDLLSHPTADRSVHTVVLACLPAPAGGEGEPGASAAHGASAAAPAASAAARAAFPDLEWAVDVPTAGGGSASVPFDDLELEPAHLLVLGDDVLATLAALHLGSAEASGVAVDLDRLGEAAPTSSVPIRELLRTLTGRAAGPHELANLAGDAPGVEAAVAQSRAALGARLVAMAGAADALASSIEASLGGSIEGLRDAAAALREILEAQRDLPEPERELPETLPGMPETRPLVEQVLSLARWGITAASQVP